MRLIDADKLILHLNDWRFGEAESTKDGELIDKIIEQCIEAVENTPTVMEYEKLQMY